MSDFSSSPSHTSPLPPTSPPTIQPPTSPSSPPPTSPSPSPPTAEPEDSEINRDDEVKISIGFADYMFEHMDNKVFQRRKITREKLAADIDLFFSQFGVDEKFTQHMLEVAGTKVDYEYLSNVAIEDGFSPCRFPLKLSVDIYPTTLFRIYLVCNALDRYVIKKSVIHSDFSGRDRSLIHSDFSGKEKSNPPNYSDPPIISKKKQYFSKKSKRY